MTQRPVLLSRFAAMHNGQVIGGDDSVTPGLFALGPLSQGSLWEITAVPEIVQQADAAATKIASGQQLTETHPSQGRLSQPTELPITRIEASPRGGSTCDAGIRIERLLKPFDFSAEQRSKEWRGRWFS